MKCLHMQSRLVSAIALLCFSCSLTAYSQEVIPPDLGTGTFPPGLLESNDLKSVAKLRVESLKHGIPILEARYREGVDGIGRLLEAQHELAITQWESTDNDKEKLQFLEQGTIAAIMAWQQAAERLKIGLDNRANEALARMTVFRMRHLWFKEKARQETEKTKKE